MLAQRTEIDRVWDGHGIEPARCRCGVLPPDRLGRYGPQSSQANRQVGRLATRGPRCLTTQTCRRDSRPLEIETVGNSRSGRCTICNVRNGCPALLAAWQAFVPAGQSRRFPLGSNGRKLKATVGPEESGRELGKSWPQPPTNGWLPLSEQRPILPLELLILFEILAMRPPSFRLIWPLGSGGRALEIVVWQFPGTGAAEDENVAVGNRRSGTGPGRARRGAHVAGRPVVRARRGFRGAPRGGSRGAMESVGPVERYGGRARGSRPGLSAGLDDVGDPGQRMGSQLRPAPVQPVAGKTRSRSREFDREVLPRGWTTRARRRRDKRSW